MVTRIYRPDRLAIRSKIVGVTVPSLTNGVFDEYLGGIEEVFCAAGIQVLVCNVRYSAAEEERAISTLLGHHPKAMILAGIDQSDLSRAMLETSGVPIVQTMDVTDSPIDMNVGLSHMDAGYAATRYLQDLGFRRIGHLTAHGDPRSRRRYLGYQRAMEERQVGIDDLVAKSAEPSSAQLGSRLMVELMAKSPDVEAVFCCNDDLALGVLFECQRRGMRVPHDLAIVGFNDLKFAAMTFPSLTSVTTQRRQIGERAAQLIMEIVRDSRTRSLSRVVDVGFHISVRASTPLRPDPAHRRWYLPH